VRVQIDSHVEFDGHRHSVPHAFIGLLLDLHVTAHAVEASSGLAGAFLFINYQFKKAKTAEKTIRPTIKNRATPNLGYDHQNWRSRSPEYSASQNG
jgi:hypothetical protein